MRANMGLRLPDKELAILKDIGAGMAAVSIEELLLVLSGIKTDEGVRFYQKKIDLIFDRFLGKCAGKNLTFQSKPPLYLHQEVAGFLFEYLWTSKPRRFGENFLLTQVIDAQLNSGLHHSVGTCVGLTSLYSVLGLRAGLRLTLLVNSDHLLSRLRVGERTIDIDHTDPQGFDCKNCQDFLEWPLSMLAASVLNSRGLENEMNGKFIAAKSDYEKAILFNPKYANAFNNRGNMKAWEGDIEGAIADYSEAIRINPDFCEAYCNRGMANQKAGRYDEARMDYNAAMRLNSNYSDARKCLQLLVDSGASGCKNGLITSSPLFPLED